MAIGRSASGSRSGVQGHKPGPEPKLDPREVKALRKQGLLLREIMAEVGASKASVYGALREA